MKRTIKTCGISSAPSFQMHSEDNLASYEREWVCLSVRMLMGFSIFRGYALDSIAWWHLNTFYARQCRSVAAIQDAHSLIPQVRQSHQKWCLLKSLKPRHPIPFICQPACLHTLCQGNLPAVQSIKSVMRSRRCPGILKSQYSLFF